MDDFEKQLKELRFQDPPPELKALCLKNVQSKADKEKTFSRWLFLECLVTWLRPYPRAWTGFACMWFICLGLNHWAGAVHETMRSDGGYRSIPPTSQKHLTPLHASLMIAEEMKDTSKETEGEPMLPESQSNEPSAYIRMEERITMVS